jgi:branched-subunit amino acid ABC-type transport system permease component
MEILVSSLAAGLLIGMVFALVALGLTIIFGVMDIVNFAHGEFLMLGMYTALLTAQSTGVDPLLTLPLAGVVGFLLGVGCYFGFVRFLLRGPMVAQLLGTFGLMLVLRNLALLFLGSEDRTIHFGLLFTMIAFAIVALGGFGSIPGAFFAGLIVGLITEIPGLWDFFTALFHLKWMAKVPMTSFKYTFVYLAYFIIMLVRPRGLFGWKH